MKQIILTILVSISMLAAQAQEQQTGQQAEKEKPLTVSQDDKDFTIYPNPSNGVFTVSLANMTAKRAELRIMNVIGNEIYHETLTRDNALLSTTVDLSRYSKAKGLYYVKLETDNFSVVRRVIVK
ncbi:T9SS type A sorting domain-containing protein [Pontibacter sp. KCTC 32443]|uniref:T9SS type A sorting domain-containing protein n=1 Tax=Pontibacter TaxID=323449 RepID=UPI00164E4631|nr:MULTISPECIES: T9SS type A sorting domain-containing protein [Pontibacter]MBC5774296.1 T9SS type A sorting domain-containing protein [Pontibacter sp. KCTC 32443]